MTEVEPVEIDEEPARDPDAAPLPEDRFSDRELSWLAFNERVLTQAWDTRHPLLERVKFLAIVGTLVSDILLAWLDPRIRVED